MNLSKARRVSPAGFFLSYSNPYSPLQYRFLLYGGSWRLPKPNSHTTLRHDNRKHTLKGYGSQEYQG
jgi:hypothetical protein